MEARRRRCRCTRDLKRIGGYRQPTDDGAVDASRPGRWRRREGADEYHGEALIELLGEMRSSARRAAVGGLATTSERTPRVVIATGRYIGEGFDDPRLDTLLLALPIAWKGTVVQYAGRLHRPHPGKHEALVYHYVDAELRRQAGQDPRVIAIAWRAQRRLSERWRHLHRERRKPAGVVAIACARELASFLWEAATLD